MAGLIVRPRSRILHGHDWVYSTEVQKIYGTPEDGGLVSLRDGKDRLLGTAIYNGRSKIVARRISHNRATLDRTFFEQRIQRAREWRRLRGCDPDLCRVVWSESDGLPGVILDRYGSVGVLQTLTLAMDRHKQEIAEIASELLGLDAVIERNDTASRRLEGLEASIGLLTGSTDGHVSVVSGGIAYALDLFSGHKTGFYLDQRENHRHVAKFAGDRRVLDIFSNQGGFALACAKAGAKEVTAVDSSSECVRRLEVNARSNQCVVRAIEADAFDFLRKARHSKHGFDLVILDPPSFTKGKGGMRGALEGYDQLHRAVASLLAPGGLLASFSCSHHVGGQEFLESLRRGFYEAGRRAHVLETLGQASDHPVLLSMPETAYLTGFVVQVF